MQQSGRNNPCPHCGRTKDGDCRWSDSIVLCHSGSDLRPGEVITLNGADWYLSRHGGGYDGQAAVFKRHKPRGKEPVIVQRRRATVQLIDDLNSIERKLAEFDALAAKALNIPPVEQMLDIDIRASRDHCDQAHQLAKELLRRLLRAKRSDPSLVPAWESIANTQRQLRFQLADLNEYCANPAAYWQKHLLHTSVQPHLLINSDEQSDWAFWNIPDLSYQPTHERVAELYNAHRGHES